MSLCAYFCALKCIPKTFFRAKTTARRPLDSSCQGLVWSMASYASLRDTPLLLGGWFARMSDQFNLLNPFWLRMGSMLWEASWVHGSCPSRQDPAALVLIWADGYAAMPCEVNILFPVLVESVGYTQLGVGAVVVVVCHILFSFWMNEAKSHDKNRFASARKNLVKSGLMFSHGVFVLVLPVFRPGRDAR